MKYGGKLLVWLRGQFGLRTTQLSFLAVSLIALAALPLSVGADTPDTTGLPYEEIINRNVFSLKPLPTGPGPEDNKPPPPKITLTGIATVPSKRALMETPGPQPKPGTAGSVKLFYMLGVGQREGGIEVLDIDETKGAVKVRNGGQELTLTFEKDGAKLPATQAPAPVGMPNALPGVPPPPGGFAPAIKTAGAATGIPSFPSRDVRTPVAGSSPNGYMPAGGVMPAGGAVPNVNVGGVAMPSFSGSQAQNNMSQSAMPDRLYTHEEQPILIEANRTAGAPFAGLLPPTQLNPRANVNGGQPDGQGMGQGQNPQMPFPGVPGRPQLPPPPGRYR